MTRAIWQITLAAALLMTALSGCDKATEALASSVSEADVKKEYVDNCIKEAMNTSNGLMTQTQAADICDCSYEESAKQYSDRDEWKKAIVGYGFQENPELEARVMSATEMCVMKILGDG